MLTGVPAGTQSFLKKLLAEVVLQRRTKNPIDKIYVSLVLNGIQTKKLITESLVITTSSYFWNGPAAWSIVAIESFFFLSQRDLNIFHSMTESPVK